MTARSRYRRAAMAPLLLLGLGLLPWLASCGGQPVVLNYPGEMISFTADDGEPPRIFAGIIRDRRPAKQRAGEGNIMGITYPSDESWDRPVTEIYGEALMQDLVQTELVQVVPLRSQAEYSLEVDILSLTSRIQRSWLNMLGPFAAGVGVGLVLGEDTSDGLKDGAVIGAVSFMAISMPTEHRAVAEARVTLRDSEGEVAWETTCLGEVEERIYLTAADKNFQRLVDKQLTRAIKRCNNCLLAQLRQQMLADLLG